MNIPLAERIRPKSLEDFIGQEHLISKDGFIYKSMKSGMIPSMIFWGPPGVGKTTLAEIIAEQSKRPFFKLSAINSGVKDIRNVIDQAKKSEGLFTRKNPILFIDEIHRFSKSQQDSLLEAVEKGWVTLIGATTENPSFEVISALLSRCQVYVLQSFEVNDFDQLLKRALKKDTFLSQKNIKIIETDSLIRASSGDARKMLNILELLIGDADDISITNELVERKIQENSIRYDKTGEQHYDIISAFIKSIRGSDPNAAVYWLARMIEGGEDIKFIARRMIISASEDIGNANPTALILANNTFQAVSVVGNPEARIILSQCAIYLASSPKSNASYLAIGKAQQEVRKSGDLSVPLHLRNAPTQLMKNFGLGKNYIYPHDHDMSFINQEYLPEEIKGTAFYQPKNNKKEHLIKSYLKSLWKDKY